jgi:SAM-dependent methyltransferase
MDQSSAADGVYDDDEDVNDEDEDDDEEYEDEEDEYDDGPAAFVAWLKPPQQTNSTTSSSVVRTINDICVGEVRCVSSQPNNFNDELSASYCVVYELARLLDAPHCKDTAVGVIEEGKGDGKPSERLSKKQRTEKEEEEEDNTSPTTMLYYTFTNGFPFRVLPISACTAVQLQSIDVATAATTAAATTTTFANDADDACDGMHQQQQQQNLFALDYNSVIEILNAANYRVVVEDDSIGAAALTATIAPSVDKVIKGVMTWWKSGEANSGWDISNIPNMDFTQNDASMLLGYRGLPLSSSLSAAAAAAATTTTEINVNDDDDDGDNILLQLYGVTCANQLSLKTTATSTARVVSSLEHSYNYRTELCSYFAWAIPNTTALQTLLDLGPILEIGAGTGYWAYLLSKHGGDVVAYDMKDSHEGQSYRFRHSLVQDGGVEQIQAKCHSHRTLLLCWPDIVEESVEDDADRGSFSLDCLIHYNGDVLAYIGELGPHVVRTKKGWGDVFPPGGSSSSAAFQVELKESFDLVTRVCLPNWPPYNSHLTIWHRKNKTKGSTTFAKVNGAL